MFNKHVLRLWFLFAVTVTYWWSGGSKYYMSEITTKKHNKENTGKRKITSTVMGRRLEITW